MGLVRRSLSLYVCVCVCVCVFERECVYVSVQKHSLKFPMMMFLVGIIMKKLKSLMKSSTIRLD